MPESLVANPEARAAASSWRRSVGVLSLVTIAIGLANYLTSFAAVRLLPANQFADYAAGQGLLLVLGTGSLAALPWAVARYLARSDEANSPGQAMYFGLAGSALQAAVLAPVAFAVCWSLDGPLFGLAGAAATVMISLLAGPVGFLQGREQLTAIAALRAVETFARVAATMVVIVFLSRSATAVLLAFPIGSAIALGYGLRRGRAGFPLHRPARSTALRLTRDAASLGGIQVLLTMLGALDTVYAAAGHFTVTEAASYQAAALLARIPLFFSAAISTAAYTTLASAPDEAAAGRQIRSALRTYLWLAVPFVVGYLTLPSTVLHIAVPAGYGDTLPVLRMLCIAGLFIGVINVLTTVHQARAGFRGCLRILGVAVLVQAGLLLLIGHTGHLLTFAAAAMLVSATTLALLVRDARRWLHVPLAAVLRVRRRGVVAAAATVGAALASGHPVIWALLLVIVAGCAVSAAFIHPASATDRTTPDRTTPDHTTPAHDPCTNHRLEELSR